LIKLKEILNSHGTASSKELILSGNCNQDYWPCVSQDLKSTHSSADSENEKLFYLDSQFILEVLSLKCLNLQRIQLEYLDLSMLRFDSFLCFPNLKSLTLKWCNLGDQWFHSDESESTYDAKLKSLKSLNLFRNNCVINLYSTKSICRLVPNLTKLTINQSNSSIRDDSIEIIVNELHYLDELDLINTAITDQAIFTMCESNRLSKSLTRLNLSMSSSISNSSLTAIAQKLVNLKSLYLTSCFGISNLNSLLVMQNLIYLNINNTSIDKNRIKEVLLPTLPKCEVDYGHLKMLNHKLMYTINGSRNCVCSF
jgi:hypothetical protein